MTLFDRAIMMIMDMQIGLFCGVFSIIASLIVYAVLSFYSIKEDSFDEARANRRKLFKEYLDQSRPNSDKTKQKKTKKNTKKIKEKKPDQPVEEDEEKKEQKPPKEEVKEVTQPPKEPQPAPAPKKSAKAPQNAPKPKPQPMDKEEVTVQNTAPVVNEPVPKKVSDKKVKNKVVEKQPEPETNLTKDVPAKEAVTKEVEKKIKIEVKPEKKKTDNPVTSAPRKNASGGEKHVINVNSILSLIQKAELSRSEVQLLIDTLLNSEDETSEWLKVKKLDSGRQESNVKLKKQVADLELSLKNEKQISLSLQNKLKELRSDMVSDKSNVTMLKETVNRMQQEKDDLLYEKSDLSMKLKATIDEKHELQDQLNKEMSKVQQQQKIDDDHHHEVLALKDEINAANSQLEALESDNASLKSHIGYLEEELTAHKATQEKIAGMERTLNAITQKLTERDNEVANLRKQLDNSSAVVGSLKKENKDLKTEKDNLSSQVSTLSSEIKDLKEELESISLKQAEEENEDCEKENGEVANGFATDHDYQLLLEEKEQLLNQMTKQYDNSTANYDLLKQEFTVISEENKKLKKLVDETNADLSSLKSDLSVIKNRNSECEEAISQLKTGINEKNVELTSMKDELEKYKQRNNELRNKNWKVVEALSKAEKALQDKLKSEEVDNGGNHHKNVEELKNNVNKFIRRLFPDIAIQEYQGHFNDWLRSVEEAVSSNNLKYCPEDLQAQNAQLQSMVSYYKKIISETEDMLNKLQSHVEIQETKWKEEISSLQQEVEILRGTRSSS